jgi:hypothetical protein
MALNKPSRFGHLRFANTFFVTKIKVLKKGGKPYLNDCQIRVDLEMTSSIEIEEDMYELATGSVVLDRKDPASLSSR